MYWPLKIERGDRRGRLLAAAQAELHVRTTFVDICLECERSARQLPGSRHMARLLSEKTSLPVTREQARQLLAQWRA